jgi:hypothetical protein
MQVVTEEYAEELEITAVDPCGGMIHFLRVPLTGVQNV